MTTTRTEARRARQEKVADQASESDTLQVALDAAGLGVWNWEVESGGLTWSPQTYRLFGLQPGALALSYDTSMALVHHEDRDLVAASFLDAAKNGGRSVIVFRINRSDGAVRWMRCVGRASTDAEGRLRRMIGVVDDITDEREALAAGAGALHAPQGERAAAALAPAVGSAAAAGDAPAAGHAPAAAEDALAAHEPAARGSGEAWSFSTRQVAQILGVGEATVKRLADAGTIQCLRSASKGARRFAPEHVVLYLRQGRAPGDLRAALRDEDANECIAHLIESFDKGTTVEEALDDLAVELARPERLRFGADLLSRIPSIVPEHSKAGSALVATAGAAQGLQTQLIECLLRSRGFEVLRPAENTSPSQLPMLAHRTGAKFAALVIPEAPLEVQKLALAAAAEIGTRLRGGSVCVSYDGALPLQSTVTRIDSMRALGRLLRGA